MWRHPPSVAVSCCGDRLAGKKRAHIEQQKNQILEDGGVAHLCQVFQCRTLLLGYHLVQQHSLGPVQGCGVLHQLHAVIQQRSTSTEQSARSQTEAKLTVRTVFALLLTFSEQPDGSVFLLL